MEPGHWPSEHSDALRDYFLKGMSYAEIGRQCAKRLGLAAPARMTSPSIVPSLPSGACLIGPPRPVVPNLNLPPKSAMKPARVKLRCVGVQPRLVALGELGRDDCRYPYGGDKDGEGIAFCGHPRQQGSSYCTPHARLTRKSEAASARAAGPVVLRLISAA
ncbi:GcrA family cell cycle regulator [Bradyrhizobium japonicum]|uniref:GcrA family cell cycle regulator n=1 Tax=Bradyrhizobium japonicum TaxID=375 RepID=UPI00057734F2|nr:GcrA family cell cycle regulator [Bradyrhizobium japonicum]